MDLYAGGRWSELVGQHRHEYSSERKAIAIREPLKEIGGTLLKGARPANGTFDETVITPASLPQRGKGRKGRTKTPAGTRWVELPPSIAVFYEELMESRGQALAPVELSGALLATCLGRHPSRQPGRGGLPGGDSADTHFS